MNKDPPKSQPFQCCLQEYGVRLSQRTQRRRGRIESDGDVDSRGEDEGVDEDEDEGWERRWRMFGTTIM